MTPLAQRDYSTRGRGETRTPKTAIAVGRWIDASVPGCIIQLIADVAVQKSGHHQNQGNVQVNELFYGRPYRRNESPIVDWRLHLRETFRSERRTSRWRTLEKRPPEDPNDLNEKTPFTSRSPGIATLGPSFDHSSRQLN